MLFYLQRLGSMVMLSNNPIRIGAITDRNLETGLRPLSGVATSLGVAGVAGPGKKQQEWGRWWGHYQRRRGMSSGSCAGAAGVLAGRDTPRAGPRKVKGPGHRPGGHRKEVRRSAPAAEHQPGPHGRRGP